MNQPKIAKNAQAHAVIAKMLASGKLHRRAAKSLSNAKYWIEFGNTSYAWSYVMQAGEYANITAIAQVWVD